MENHFTLSDFEFEQQFESGTLSPELFNHEAHLRLAWIHIDKYGIDKAIDNLCFQLLNYVTKLGAAHKFNKTLTVAAVKAVYHFMLRSESGTFRAFIREFPRLKYNFKDLMSCHYGVDIYNSPWAKKHFLEPDLLPFD
ncbi:hypothetical protein [Sinomicrobium weinanense]|uniref:Uncharacterized protein n=1 Tax=Sinomicrobium weinanense TaxID=2842200 RepID=A0A926JRW3_9FLAO|nr:hypothetical protein [Sinomicrobium weinanense]MBC9796246.1 hypothetical protein [Sinomicrobium weinanense]MBU3122299.1 hypothetical protein [Sinomicrobium weinanense]